MPQSWVKTNPEVLDYKFDFSDWLPAGDTIVTRTITPDSGITVDSSSITDTDTSVTVWLSGGTARVDYNVTCLAVTAQGRTVERAITIRMRDAH